MFKFGRSGQRHLGICRRGRACPICCQSERGAGPRDLHSPQSGSRRPGALEVACFCGRRTLGADPPEQRTPTHSSFLEEAVVLALTGNESFLCFSLSVEADLSTPPQSSPRSGALHDFPQTSPEAPFSINLDPELQGPENKFLRTKCKELIV